MINAKTKKEYLKPQLKLTVKLKSFRKYFPIDKRNEEFLFLFPIKKMV